MDSNFSRRDFLKASAGVLAVSAFAGVNEAAASAPKNVPIGVQLYCVRKELETDFPGVLSALAKMGYQGVEFADYYKKSAKELRQLLDDHGLKACGTHIFLDDMLGDKLAPTVEFNKTLGNKYLVVRYLPDDYRNSESAFLKTIDLFSKVAEDLEPHGMRVGYHNHDYIFQKFGKETLWNTLADRANKKVFLQLDTGNAAMVGVDVAKVIKRNKGRSTTVHIKPYSSKNPNAYLGQDELNWKKILSALNKRGGMEWQIIEYEQEGIPPLEALKANLDQYRKMIA